MHAGMLGHWTRRWLVSSLLCCVGTACSNQLPAPNPLPDLGVEDTVERPDRPKAVLPPQVCVGLTPAEDKWLPEVVEETVVEEAIVESADDAFLASDGDDTGDASEDAELAEVAEVQDAVAELPPGPQPPPFFPGDTASGDAFQEDGAADVADADAPDADAAVDPCVHKPATCTGASMPSWELLDFQPRSCGYKATYGLDLYKGHVTVVALLAAW